MPEKMLNVCFVTEDFYPGFIGGQGIWGKEVVKYLVKHRAYVTVIAEQKFGRSAYWHNKKNIQLSLVPFCFGNQLILAFTEYISVGFFLRKTHFDIVHASQLSGLLFILWKPNNVENVVISSHNTWTQMADRTTDRFKKFLYRPLIFLESLVYKKADALAFHTESQQAFVFKEFGIGKKLYAVIPMGAPRVRIDEKQRIDAGRSIREALGILKNSSIVLYVGRLVRRKNVETLLKSLSIMQKKHIAVIGIMIGKGNDEKRLKLLAPPNTIFTGFVNDIAPYYLASDVFVLPSVAEGGVALSILEAMAYGLPIVTTSEAAGPSLVKNGFNGYIVKPLDSQAFTQAIRNSIYHKKAFGRESRRMTISFSWDRTAEEMITLYRTLLKRPIDTTQ